MLLAALLLSTGKIADTWGRKRAFLIGLTIFVAGSVLAGFSTSAATLISACAVQEIGAAFIMSSVLSTVNAVFRGKYRAAAFGVRSAVISGEAAVGPLAGGARDFGCGVRAVYPAGKHRERGHLSALLDLGLFSYSTFSWGNITAGAIAIGQFAIIFVLPLYLINALDLSTMLAGLVLAAMAIGAFFSGAAAPHVAARYGAPGTVLIGLGLEAVGVLIFVLLMGPDTNGWIIAAPLTLYGLGLGFASATQSTVRQIGAVVQALSEGMTNATQWSLVAVTAFLAWGFVCALRVRRAAGEKCAPASNADLGARVNRVPN